MEVGIKSVCDLIQAWQYGLVVLRTENNAVHRVRGQLIACYFVWEQWVACSTAILYTLCWICLISSPGNVIPEAGTEIVCIASSDMQSAIAAMILSITFSSCSLSVSRSIFPIVIFLSVLH